MKIESIIKRPGGTLVEMDAPKRAYQFAPEGGNHDNPHIADVDVTHHAQALLRIREGFRLVEGEDAPPAIAQAAISHDETLIGSNVHNASYVIKGGDTVQLGDLVVMAFQDSNLSHEEWNDLPDQQRYEYIDATLRELQLGEGEEQADPPAPVEEKKAGDVSENATDVEPPVIQPEDKAETGNNANGQTEQNNDEQPKVDAPEQEITKPKIEEQPEADVPEKDDAEPKLDELREQFKTKFGRYPSTQMKVENIVAALSEDDE